MMLALALAPRMRQATQCDLGGRHAGHFCFVTPHHKNAKGFSNDSGMIHHGQTCGCLLLHGTTLTHDTVTHCMWSQCNFHSSFTHFKTVTHAGLLDLTVSSSPTTAALLYTPYNTPDG